MTIKPKELRIGNYLRLGCLPFRVAQVTTPTTAGDLYDGFILEDGTEDAGEPIVLTEEILAKMGFHHQGWYAMVYEQKQPERRVVWEIGSHMLRITRDDSTYEKSKRHTMVAVYADTLHRLQNLLVDCDIDIDFELKPSDIQ